MAVNKVEINGEVKLDLTQDTVTEDTLLQGITAHDAVRWNGRDRRSAGGGDAGACDGRHGVNGTVFGLAGADGAHHAFSGARKIPGGRPGRPERIRRDNKYRIKYKSKSLSMGTVTKKGE